MGRQLLVGLGLLQFQVPLGFLEELEAVGHLSDLSEWCGEDCSIM